MKKRGIGFILYIFVIFGVFHIASAEIFMGQPDDLYNIGDELRMNVSLLESSSTTSFFSAVLTCENKEVEIYRAPISLKSGEQRAISFFAKMDRAIINDLIGECFILAKYAGKEERSRNFEISNLINTQIFLQKSVYSPEEKLEINGRAVKKNGKEIDGFINVKINELEIDASEIVKNGNFNISFNVPSQAVAENYFIEIEVYEKDDSGEITNIGNSKTSFKVKQIPKKIEIAFIEENVFPGKDFLYLMKLNDQSGKEISSDLNLVIYDSKGIIIEKRVVNTGESNILILEKNATPGNWKIESSLGELKEIRSFYVEQVEKAGYEVNEGILTIFNEGNVVYKKPLEIFIGDVKEIKEIELDVGEVKKFRLSAPEGNYPIQIYDGEENRNVGSSYLTGNAVSVRNLESTGSIASSLIIWLMVALSGAFAFVYGRSVIKKKFYGRMPETRVFNLSNNNLSKIPDYSMEERVKNNVSSGYVNKSSKRGESSIIALNIKNMQEISEDEQASSMIKRAVRLMKEAKAIVKQDNDGYFFVFSDGIDNNVPLYAVKKARILESQLQDYNRKNALNINFGLGGNFGEMIIEKSLQGEIFHSLGNTSIVAKRAAEKSNGELLISQPLHRKTANVVKTEFLREDNLFKIKHIIEREEHEEFIDRFMNRQKR